MYYIIIHCIYIMYECIYLNGRLSFRMNAYFMKAQGVASIVAARDRESTAVICLSACLCISLSVRLFVRVYVCFYASRSMSVCLSIFSCACLYGSIDLNICLHLRPFVTRFVC